MLPVWTLLLLVVQALSSPRYAYYEGPDHLQTLTFALQDDGLTDQTHIQKFERILQCTEYFMSMIKNAKKKTKPIPMHPKMGKAKFTGIDSFDVANQIVMRKDQDYSTCEMIWSSFKSLMSGDIYEEIDNADDLVQYLSVLLSDENGKQKVFKVIPDMSYNTIDSDQDEMMAAKHAMKTHMKKLPQKGVVKNLIKRAGGGGGGKQGGGGGGPPPQRKESSKNSDNDIGNDSATSSNKALDTEDSDETISGKNQFASTSTNQQVGAPAVGPLLDFSGLFDRRKRSVDALEALDILLTIFLDISPLLNQLRDQIFGPISEKFTSGMKKRSPEPINPYTIKSEEYGEIDIDFIIQKLGELLGVIGRKKRSPEQGVAELCLSVSEKLKQLINDIVGNILPPLRNVLKKRSPQGRNLVDYFFASTIDIEETLHDIINILAVLLGNPPPFKRSTDEINAISRHIRANNNENNKGKLNDIDIEKALQFLQSLGIDRSLFSSAGPNIGKRSANEMEENEEHTIQKRDLELIPLYEPLYELLNKILPGLGDLVRALDPTLRELQNFLNRLRKRDTSEINGEDLLSREKRQNDLTIVGEGLLALLDQILPGIRNPFDALQPELMNLEEAIYNFLRTGLNFNLRKKRAAAGGDKSLNKIEDDVINTTGELAEDIQGDVSDLLDCLKRRPYTKVLECAKRPLKRIIRIITNYFQEYFGLPPPFAPQTVSIKDVQEGQGGRKKREESETEENKSERFRRQSEIPPELLELLNTGDIKELSDAITAYTSSLGLVLNNVNQILGASPKPADGLTELSILNGFTPDPAKINRLLGNGNPPSDLGVITNNFLVPTIYAINSIFHLLGIKGPVDSIKGLGGVTKRNIIPPIPINEYLQNVLNAITLTPFSLLDNLERALGVKYPFFEGLFDGIALETGQEVDRDQTEILTGQDLGQSGPNLVAAINDPLYLLVAFVVTSTMNQLGLPAPVNIFEKVTSVGSPEDNPFVNIGTIPDNKRSAGMFAKPIYCKWA